MAFDVEHNDSHHVEWLEINTKYKEFLYHHSNQLGVDMEIYCVDYRINKYMNCPTSEESDKKYGQQVIFWPKMGFPALGGKF